MTDFPQELEVTVTSAHLTHGKRDDYNESPLALALREQLTAMGVEYTQVTVTENRIYVYLGLLRRGHDACYYVSDQAWKLVARHRAGRRVKPADLALKAIYIRTS